MPDTENSEDGARSGSPLTGVVLGVAIAVVVVWLGLLIWLVIDADASEVTWSRSLVVLGSIEAVAFAAVGAMFGTTVQKQRLEDLKTQTDAAESRADANQTAALNGHKLAAAVKATYAARADGTAERLSADDRYRRDALRELADRLFPD